MSRGAGGLALAGLSFPRMSGDEPFAVTWYVAV